MTTQINIEIDSTTLKKLVLEHLTDLLRYEVKPQDVSIMVKTKQNYKAEWEEGDFRARISKHDIDK
jgi:hypothetical protein